MIRSHHSVLAHFTRAAVLGMVVVSLCHTLDAAPPTPAQRKELADIRADAGKVRTLITRKKFDEARAEITALEDRLGKLAQEVQVTAEDPAIAGVQRVIDAQKTLLDKADGGGGMPKEKLGVSFVDDVVPILSGKCGNCHGDNARGGLRLDTFAGMKRGGQSGPLLVPGNPAASLLCQRLTSPNPQARMPRGPEPLTAQEIQTIAAWIAGGATFDGDDETAILRSLRKKTPDEPEPEVAMATGKESVSFTKDIAPTLLNTCGGCHSDQRRAGGLSVMSFEKLLRGGESGRVLVAGNLEGSRLWRLVNGDETPVMPAGNMTGITREFYNNLRTWITEGVKYDGGDPKRPLRDLVPTAEEMQAAELAKLTPEDWLKKRQADSADMWKRTFRDAPMRMVEGDDLLVMGDLPQERLQQVHNWAADQLQRLKTAFNIQDKPVFKGKLAVFVFKDRFGYDEFNSTVERRTIPREIHGHSTITAGQERALVALYDLGDEPTTTSPGTQLVVLEHVTSAVLQRSGRDMPDWLVAGTGLALAGASGASTANPYLSQLNIRAADSLRGTTLTQPAQVLADGSFPPGDVPAIGYTLVQFMLRQGGPASFGQFVARLQGGDSLDAALRAVYRADSASIGTAFAASLANVGGKK
ncbi:MAG: hypothetical protein KF777_10600 [Planctomycetaceae bacterium]|nr:hypothetical protein [Planctomycetaceae bacterium]